MDTAFRLGVAKQENSTPMTRDRQFGGLFLQELAAGNFLSVDRVTSTG